MGDPGFHATLKQIRLFEIEHLQTSELLLIFILCHRIFDLAYRCHHFGQQSLIRSRPLHCLIDTQLPFEIPLQVLYLFPQGIVVSLQLGPTLGERRSHGALCWVNKNRGPGWLWTTFLRIDIRPIMHRVRAHWNLLFVFARTTFGTPLLFPAFRRLGLTKTHETQHCLFAWATEIPDKEDMVEVGNRATRLRAPKNSFSRIKHESSPSTFLAFPSFHTSKYG